MPPPRKKSLQDVLRERRAAAPLLTVHELHEREASRRREEVVREARELVERWRRQRTAVDVQGKLTPELYRAVFAAERPAYYGSKHWARRTRAQLERTPSCEVTRCGRTRGAPCVCARPHCAWRGTAGRGPRHALRLVPPARNEAGAGARAPGRSGRAPWSRSGAAALHPGGDRRAADEAQSPATRARRVMRRPFPAAAPAIPRRRGRTPRRSAGGRSARACCPCRS